MERTFRVIATLKYDMDTRKRSDAELEAEGRFIKQMGDALVVVEKFNELEWIEFEKKKGEEVK